MRSETHSFFGLEAENTRLTRSEATRPCRLRGVVEIRRRAVKSRN